MAACLCWQDILGQMQHSASVHVLSLACLYQGLSCREGDMLLYTHARTTFVIGILLTANLQMAYTSLKTSLPLGYKEYEVFSL